MAQLPKSERDTILRARRLDADAKAAHRARWPSLTNAEVLKLPAGTWVELWSASKQRPVLALLLEKPERWNVQSLPMYSPELEADRPMVRQNDFVSVVGPLQMPNWTPTNPRET